MKRAFFLLIGLLSALALAHSIQRSATFRLIGKWKGQLHFENPPPDFPKDLYGTVEAKPALGSHVEAFVHMDALPGGRPIEARGILGGKTGTLATGRTIETVNSVFFLDWDPGYLPMNGTFTDKDFILSGERVPRDPNGGQWRVSVEFKGEDEIDVWFLDSNPDPNASKGKLGYIKLTRMKE